MSARRNFLRLLGVAGLAAVVLPSGAFAADAAKPKILVLTHATGFWHPSLPVGEQVLTEMGQKSGVFEAVCLKGYEQGPPDKLRPAESKFAFKPYDLSIITSDYLKQFKAIVFFTQGSPPLSESQRKAILDFVKNGGGAIVIHCGTDSFWDKNNPTYSDWPDYVTYISGGAFLTHHPNDKNLTLKVEDKKHPATKMLGDSWTMADEFYQIRPESFSRDRVHVLMSVDTDVSDLEPQKMEKGKDYAISWCRTVEKGKSFTTVLGHREDVWTNPKFQDHLMGGIKWVLGLEPGDATPSGAKK